MIKCVILAVHGCFRSYSNASWQGYSKEISSLVDFVLFLLGGTSPGMGWDK